MNFHFTLGGSARARKARRAESWGGPSIDFEGEDGAAADSGVR